MAKTTTQVKTKEEKPGKQRRKAVRKEKGILIRVTDAQKALLAEAAESAGHALSPWILSAALREAKRLKRADEI